MMIKIVFIGALSLVALFGGRSASANNWTSDDYGFLVEQRAPSVRNSARPRPISRLFQRWATPCPARNAGDTGDASNRESRSATTAIARDHSLAGDILK